MVLQEEMQELCGDLLAIVRDGFTDLRQKLFDLTCSKLKENTEVMRALVKVAVAWASELLEVALLDIQGQPGFKVYVHQDVGVPTLYVSLVASSIKLAPRVMDSFQTVSVKLRQLTKKICRCSKGATQQALQVPSLPCVVADTNACADSRGACRRDLRWRGWAATNLQRCVCCNDLKILLRC